MEMLVLLFTSLFIKSKTLTFRKRKSAKTPGFSSTVRNYIS